jgi:hypothetical protein
MLLNNQLHVSRFVQPGRKVGQMPVRALPPIECSSPAALMLRSAISQLLLAVSASSLIGVAGGSSNGR